MKKIQTSRVGLLLLTYIIFLLLFLLQKPIFLLYYIGQSKAGGIAEWINVVIAGLPMDLSVAGYFTIVPALLLLCSIFITKGLSRTLDIYFIIASVINALIFIPDIVLYSYWGFRIDSTVLTYITSPDEAMASTPIHATILTILCTFFYAFGIYTILKRYITKYFPSQSAQKKSLPIVIFLPLLGLMFIAIRGGITTSTMSVSRVYYSNNMFYNHAAINPVFNMLYSIKLNDNFDKEYRFFDNEKAETIFSDLMKADEAADTVKILKTERPNIIFVLLESFGAPILEPLGGEKDVAPNMNKLSEEGVFFRNLYASSFRTDRGIVSALTGLPAQPTMSILKYSNKVQNLGSIPKSLTENGYKTSFLYGGDVDFAQMKTLLVTQQITDITADKDFPVELRLTKWGVPDCYTFDWLTNNIQKEKESPFIKIFLTLSSHEPFDVPTRKFDDPYLNSINYTDSCIGVFIDKLKTSGNWDNTLVVFLPDHNMRYPKNIGHYDPARHHSFMLWVGGTIKEPMNVDKVCSQVDVAATLLNQLNIASDDLPFSKNVLNPTTKEFAFYTFSNGFGMVSNSGKVAYDDDGKSVLLKEGESTDSLLIKGKAILQCLYNKIDKL